MRRSTKTILAGGFLTASLAAGLIAFGVAAPSQAATRSWLVICSGFSHSAAHDPILFPNQPGASHLHDFVGNRTTNAYSTPESLKGQASSCGGGDRSSYWVPALYQNGKKLPIAWFSIYYENRAMNAGPIQPFPEGFRMILGNSSATTVNASEGRWVFGCTDNTQIGAQTPPTNCGSGGIQIRSQWPNCWNGQRGTNNDSPNVRFSSGGNCPEGFKIPLPTMRMNVAYLTGADVGNITLASGGGSVYSKHGDFFNGWDKDVLAGLVAKCLNTDTYCDHVKGTTAAVAGVKPPPTGPVTATPPATAPTTTPPPVTRTTPPTTTTTRSATSAAVVTTTTPSVPTTTTAPTSAPTSTSPTSAAAITASSPTTSYTRGTRTRSAGVIMPVPRTGSGPWYRHWRSFDRALVKPLTIINPKLASAESPVPTGVPIVVLLTAILIGVGLVNHRLLGSQRGRRLRALGSHRR